MTDDATRPAEAPAPEWWPYALVGVGFLAVVNACWALATADWKTDEAWDGGYAWTAVHGGRWDPANGHPVFVRWFLGAGQLLLGQDRWGIRLFPALASLAAVGLLYVVGSRLHSRGAGLLAAGIWAVVPRALVVGHVVVGPLRGDRFGYLEPFMVVALLGATLTGWNWVQEGRWRDALATGALIGLAGAFKPTALVVVLPVVAMALWVQRSPRSVLGQAVAMGALAAVVLPLTYLPVGTGGPEALRTLIDFQLDHARTGHDLVVDGQLTHHQPRWAHLLYQWRGMGAAVCIGLAIGMVGAWTGRRRRPIAFVTAIWATLLGVHLLSSVALAHYYLLWAPFGVLVAAMGLVELGERTAAPRGGSNTVAERWRRAPGPATALGVAALLLVVGGAVGTYRTLTLEPGDYGRMVAALDAAGVRPTSVRFQGEAVDRYFPDIASGQVGFTDPSAPFDLLILDPRDLPLLPAGAADDARAAAQAAGLSPHQIGRLEVWYADPTG